MSKWQFYDCIDGCGDSVYASYPSRCTKCKEKYWSANRYIVVPKVSKSKSVLLFIKEYKIKHTGISPSIKDIVDGCKIGEEKTIRKILNNLEKDGKIKRNGTRSIRLVGETYIPPKDL